MQNNLCRVNLQNYTQSPNSFDTLKFKIPVEYVEHDKDFFEQYLCVLYATGEVKFSYDKLRKDKKPKGLNHISIGDKYATIQVSSKLMNNRLINLGNIEQLIQQLNDTGIIQLSFGSFWKEAVFSVAHITKDIVVEDLDKTLEALRTLRILKKYEVRTYNGNRNLTFLPSGKDNIDCTFYNKGKESNLPEFENKLRIELKGTTQKKVRKVLCIGANNAEALFTSSSNVVRDYLSTLVQLHQPINKKVKPEFHYMFVHLMDYFESDTSKVEGRIRGDYSTKTAQRRIKDFREWYQDRQTKTDTNSNLKQLLDLL